MVAEDIGVQIQLMTIQKYENALSEIKKPIAVDVIEIQVEEILELTRDYFYRPDSIRKKKLLNKVCQTSVSEIEVRGLIVDYSERFNYILSLLYRYGQYMRLPALKLYVFRVLTNVVIRDRWLELKTQLGILIPEYHDDTLDPLLKIFLGTCRWYRASGAKDDVETIYDALFYIAEVYIKEATDDYQKIKISTFVIEIIYDLAMSAGYDELDCFYHYERHDLKKVFEKLSDWIRRYPVALKETYILCNVVCVILTSMLLRLRFGLENFPVFKYISKENLESAFANGQVWMREISGLNDEREGCTVDELIKQVASRFSWQKVLDNNFVFYVGCFSRNTNPEGMNGYGHNVLGYRDDNIATRLAPVSIDAYGYPIFARVFSYDVSYSPENVKEEIDFAVSLIDKLPVSCEAKTLIYTMFISRIKYSVKDKKWEHEQERRYVIEMNTSASFIDAVMEYGFIKIVTSLYQAPDFVRSCDSCFRVEYEKRALRRIEEDISVSCSLCMDCFYIDFHSHNVSGCKQCGSKHIKRFNDIDSFA